MQQMKIQTLNVTQSNYISQFRQKKKNEDNNYYSGSDINNSYQYELNINFEVPTSGYFKNVNNI